MTIDYALPAGAVLKSKQRTYEVVETLGAGGFGITYKVVSTIMVDNVDITTYFAVKEHFMKGCFRGEDKCHVICAPSIKEEVDGSREDFIVEARRLNQLSGLSKNIVRVNEVFEYNNTAYYVMKYLDGGEMSEHISREGALSEAKALSIIRPIAKAVELIHKERLLHLDIKPDNIVLMKTVGSGAEYPVLIDFGIAKHFNASGKPTSTHSAKGASDGYAPMEQYSNIDKFAPEMDVYALGATLLHFLSGQLPKNAFEITPDDINAMLPDYVSPRTRSAVLNAMAMRMGDRTHTVKAFLDSLEEEYALPAGFVLQSPSISYRITGIDSETDSYIVYNAVLDLTDEAIEVADSSGESTKEMTAESDGRNSTRSLNNSSRTKAINKGNVDYDKEEGDKDIISFKVYELFVKHQFTRTDDGKVSGESSDAERAFNNAKRQIPDGLEGKTPEGYPLSESFSANGTRYFAYMLVEKPPIAERIKGVMPAMAKGLKATGIVLAGAAVVAGLFFGGKALFKSCGESKGGAEATEVFDDSAATEKDSASAESVEKPKVAEPTKETKEKAIEAPADKPQDNTPAADKPKPSDNDRSSRHEQRQQNSNAGQQSQRPHQSQQAQPSRPQGQTTSRQQQSQSQSRPQQSQSGSNRPSSQSSGTSRPTQPKPTTTSSGRNASDLLNDGPARPSRSASDLLN